MAKKDYNVYKGKDGKWRGERQDSDRASVVADTQKEAFEKTRELAKNNKSEVSIHRADNTKIRAKHSYGNDPKGNG
jgi:Tat protein secretion system quality control protein TatD with DNase activity